MSALSVNLAIINLEGALSGIFFALSIAAVSLLISRQVKETKVHTKGSIRWAIVWWRLRHSVLFAASIVFILVILTHFIIGVRRTFNAFVYYDNGERPVEYLNDLSAPLQVTRLAIAAVGMMMADLILIHRAWIVWGRKRWVPLPPIVTCCTFTATGLIVVHQFAVDSPTDNIYSHHTRGWIIGFFVSTLLTRTYGTVLIGMKIFAVKKSLKESNIQTTSHKALDIMMMFIESTAFSTTWTTIFAVTNVVRSPLQLLIISCSPAVNGIAFMLIIVRVGLGWDVHRNVAESRDGSQATLSPNYPMSMRPIQLRVSRAVEREADFSLSPERSVEKRFDSSPLGVL